MYSLVLYLSYYSSIIIDAFYAARWLGGMAPLPLSSDAYVYNYIVSFL